MTVTSGITSFSTSASGKSLNAFKGDTLVFTVNGLAPTDGQTPTQCYSANKDRVLSRQRALGNALIFDIGNAARTVDTELQVELAADAAELGIKLNAAPATKASAGPRRKAPKGRK